MSRYRHRPYEERIALEADDFIKAIARGEVDIPEAYDYGPELARQQAIAEVLGIGRTPADADRVRALLFDGVDTGYGVRTGAQLQGRGRLGIDGDYKSDSTVRIHRSELDGTDPLLADDVKNRALTDGYLGIETEYLSPKGAQDLYNRWAKTASDPSVENFNRFLGEYYGQQALRLTGATAVPDDYRSRNVVLNPNHPNSTLGTDRLIETNKALIGEDVGNPAGDYRYVNPQNQLVVGDYQAALFNTDDAPHMGDAEVRLQMLKGSKMTRDQRERFAGELIKAAAQTDDIDEALEIMRKHGDLPNLVQAEIKQNKRKFDRNGREITSGMRAGKMTSSGEHMGRLNNRYSPEEVGYDGPNGGQHRYQHVLFGVTDGDKIGNIAGVTPSGFYNVDTANARRYMAKNAENMPIHRGADGSAFFKPTLAQLVNDGVAVNLTTAYPQVRQLL